LLGQQRKFRLAGYWPTEDHLISLIILNFLTKLDSAVVAELALMGGSAETSICQTYVANFFEALTMGQANTQKRAYELLRTLVPNGIVGNRGDTVGSAQSSATALPSIDFTLGNDSPGHTHTYTDIFHVGSGAGKPAFKKGRKGIFG
jgi:hypothetical protein